MNLTRIALLTNGIFPYQIGGIQKHSYYLAKYFAKEEVYVDVYHPIGNVSYDINISNFYSLEELKFINFVIIDFPNSISFPGHYVYDSYLFSKNIFRRIAVEKPYDYIYAQGFTSWYFLKVNIFQHNLISNLHGLEMFQNSLSFKNKLEQFLLRIPALKIIKNSNKQVSLGGKLTDILFRNGAKRNSVVEIPNGIDENWIIDFDQLSSKSKITFVFVGRYERRKGIEEFHTIIEKLIDILGFEVLFIGPIPVNKQIKHSRIKYLGSVRDVQIIKNQLQMADILVCPSYSEGMPTVILEAMASGCAIIATDVGAVNTMVNESNGWLIKGDIIEGLEMAISDAVKLSPTKLLVKKKNSLEKARNKFVWGKVIFSTISEIKQCI